MADKKLRDIADHLNKLGNGALMDAVELVAVDYGLQAEEKTKKLMTTVLKVRSGRLRNSIRQKTTRKRSSITVNLQAGGKRLPYLMTHEEGRTKITPKKGKYLRIPLPPALTARGVDRMGAGSLRNNPDFRFVPAKNLKGKNPLLIHVPSGKPWYFLKKSVRVPPRPTISVAFAWLEQNMIPALQDAITFQLEDV